jgi:hypothetical protein
MQRFTNYFIFLLISIAMCSCFTNKNLIEKSKTEFGGIKFFEIKTQGDKASISKIYADVDSSGIKRYYSFYPDKIVMTDGRAKVLSYTVINRKLPDNYDTNIYNRFSRLDTLVFVKAEKLLKNSRYSHLKKIEGAEGYEIEVNYYHGFPKNKKFEPL